jgi:hypothetical protein
MWLACSFVSDDLPAAIAGLEVHEVEDGLVVYDAEHDRVHYLNATASVVFTFCDGAHAVDQITELVRAAWDLPDPPVAAVAECVAQLRAEGVVH